MRILIRGFYFVQARLGFAWSDCDRHQEAYFTFSYPLKNSNFGNIADNLNVSFLLYSSNLNYEWQSTLLVLKWYQYIYRAIFLLGTSIWIYTNSNFGNIACNLNVSFLLYSSYLNYKCPSTLLVLKRYQYTYRAIFLSGTSTWIYTTEVHVCLWISLNFSVVNLLCIYLFFIYLFIFLVLAWRWRHCLLSKNSKSWHCWAISLSWCTFLLGVYSQSSGSTILFVRFCFVQRFCLFYWGPLFCITSSTNLSTFLYYLLHIYTFLWCIICL